MDSSEDISTNPRVADGAPTIGDVIARRLSRRTLLGGAAASAAALALPGLSACATGTSPGTAAFTFPEIERGTGPTHVVPEGYTADLLIRWGDPLFADSPPFDPRRQTAAAQALQFGYNNDFIGFVSIDATGDRGLLFVNHEYTTTPLMFPGLTGPESLTPELFAVERAAHGASVVEIARQAGRWRTVVPSRFNRRITADTANIAISGPAAGHPRLQTSAEPTGRSVRGGVGPLTAANGFASQADVLIETRRAADLLGATPMDRPEDVEADPTSGRVYVMLTNNTQRTPGNTSPANPRAANAFGHIIEIVEPGGDLTATRSTWEILVLCGDPANAEHGARWNLATSANGWFSSPDNCAIDPRGRLWVSTDGNQDSGANDGLWALETQGALRGTGRAFFRAPNGAEVCGPRFTPDGRALFLAVQHPGDGDNANFEAPTTRWPDFSADMPPRPAVLAIYRSDGGLIGGD